jgi:hypothetical protein
MAASTALVLSPTPAGSQSAPDPLDGGGYWMLGSDGTVYDFGAAENFGHVGELGGVSLTSITAMASTPTQQGYYIVTRFGTTFTYGDADSDLANGRPEYDFEAEWSAVQVSRSGGGIWWFSDAGDVHVAGDAGNHQQCCPLSGQTGLERQTTPAKHSATVTNR